MKKQFIFIPFLLVSSLFMVFYVMDVHAAAAPAKPAPKPAAKPAAGTLAAPACSGFAGTFKATKWPGGKLAVTCPGKNRQRGKCVGGTKSLSPGEKFAFSNCNCLDPKGKCLTIGKLPAGCKLKNKLACASNREVANGDIMVDCTGGAPSGGASNGGASNGGASSGGTSPAATRVPVPSDPPSPTLIPTAAPTFYCINTADGNCIMPTPTRILTQITP
jgi:hypothetical protein